MRGHTEGAQVSGRQSALAQGLRKIHPGAIVASAAVVIAVAFTAAVFTLAWRYSYFIGDDYSTFWLSRTATLSQALLTPLGGQIVPIHRALSIVTYWLAPMNFGLALFVLGAFHAFAVAYLYRILQLLRRSRLNALLAALYATHVFLGMNVVWFSSGMTRFPYITFSLMAIYYYLTYCQTRARYALLKVVLCFFAALGFYSKGILVPLYCIGVDLARHKTPAERSDDDDAPKWKVSLALVTIGGAYGLWARTLTDVASRRTNFSASFLLDFVRSAWTVFLHSLFDQVLDFHHYTPTVLVPLATLCFTVYSVVRRPSLFRVWLIGGALISANFLLVGASNRTVFWGGLMVFEYRHYFEVCFLAVLFLGIVSQTLWSAAPEVRWFFGSWRGWVVAPVVAVVLSVHALLAYQGLSTILLTYNSDLPRARAYMRTLMSDLAQIRQREPGVLHFVDGEIPRYLDWMGFEFRRHSQLFLLLHFPASFGTQDAYMVTEGGHVTPINAR